MKLQLVSIAGCLLLAGCGSLSSGPDAGPIYVPSPNYDTRRPNYVILHDTTNDHVERPLRTLTDPARQVSAHYLIGRDGTLYQLVDEPRRAWHAGQSYWGGLTDLNSASIGIELDNTGSENYAEAQIARLLVLLDELRTRHKIPSSNVLGHGDIAPRRKVDPGRLFPWQRLADAGFGLWCRPADVPIDAPPPETALSLQAIGYDVTDIGAALQAFRRHFLGIDTDGDATESERRLMRCLAERKRENGAPASTGGMRPD